MTFVFFPAFHVEAKSSTVNNQTELKQALSNNDVDTIILGRNIDTTEKINITRTVTIDGNGKIMKYVGKFGKSGSSDNTVWGGIYVLQVYKTNAVLKNITLTGGNGGLLVNGATVKLVGTIDVSGNGFGGIELGQGVNVGTNAHLLLDTTTVLVNKTEAEDRPTIWVPKDSTNTIIEIDNVKHTFSEDTYILLEDIKTLMEPIENPDTGDLSFVYLLIGISGLLLMGYSTKKKAL